MFSNPLKRSFLCLTAEPGTVCAGLPTKKPRAAAVPTTQHQATAPAAVPPKSQFLSLPAELRNEIYNHALVQSSPISLPYAYETRSTTRSPSSRNGLASASCTATTYSGEPPFLRTSRLIRSEAMPIYYGCNTFSAPSPASAHKFLKPLSSAKMSMLRFFRPVELALELQGSLQVRKRWEESVRRTVNRLVKDVGKGSLRWESLQLGVKSRDEGTRWLGLREVGFGVKREAEGWRLLGPEEEEEAMEGVVAT
ncbi:hypothetical protein CB0940_07227 [Cercospora beticola]|uniref:2EXR domain-containing protein n=1 Tax=Cercospora beticola TaxID=122368 RepID=A0A2G5H9E3_CERBT|nr:hypothetical protein CB0940_07227 [Cercospora beticola]PIA89149.1 hypothetical protein CB0940_07227 [Cercospora beticola]WPB03159.1 hypothetical protein RHO25_007796 [Cercospora beticola]